MPHDDQIALVGAAAMLSAKLVKTLRMYKGYAHGLAPVNAAEFNEDFLGIRG